MKKRYLKMVGILIVAILLLNMVAGPSAMAGTPDKDIGVFTEDYGGCGCCGSLGAQVVKANGNPGSEMKFEELLTLVKASPEFRELETNMVSTEPSDTWQAGGLTFFVFDLKPVAKPSDAPLVLYPYAIFAASEDQGIAAVMVATPDLRTMQVELKDFNNPELSQTVMLSEGVAKELREAEERARQGLQGVKSFTKYPESRPSLGPCAWYCTETVYHPGYMDSNCRYWCTVVCSFIPDWRAKAACIAGCQLACWVPSWTECVKWELLCGLP